MQRFVWSADIEIGHQIIDSQHRQLFRLANAADAMIGKGSPKEVERCLSDLIAYTRTHFRAEEGLLKTNLFPDLAAHRREHEALSRRVQDLWANRAAVTPEQLLDLLAGWIVDHIQGTDQELKGRV